MVDKEREPESETNPTSRCSWYYGFISPRWALYLWPAIGTRPEIQYATNMHSRYTKSPLRGDMVTTRQGIRLSSQYT